MQLPADKRELITRLQREICSLQGLHHADNSTYTGLGSLEKAFPDKSFPVAAVHEFISYGRKEAAATNSFIACLLNRLMQKEGYCIWVAMRNNIYPPALKRFGIDADRILFIDAGKNTDALWTIEEALKCEQVTAVVGEVPDLDFTASRRLQLAVENSKATGLIHRCFPRQENTVACVSRWHIKSLPSQLEDNMPGIGFPRWEVTLSKVRNGRPGRWQVEWKDNKLVCTAASRSAGDHYLLQERGLYG